MSVKGWGKTCAARGLAGGLSLGLLPWAAAQSDPSNFTTVIDAPPTVIGNDFVVGTDTQLNIAGGASVGFSLNVGEPDQLMFNDDGDIIGVTPGTSTNAELNINADLGPFLQANRGGTINILGGVIGGLGGSAFDANAGSVVNIMGGEISNGFTAHAGSVVNFTGGTLKGPSSMQASVMNMSGGVLDSFFDVGGDDFATVDAVLNVTGGEIGNKLEVFSDGILNLFGSNFAVDSNPISLTEGVPFEVTDRGLGVKLTGDLADGTPFSLDLTPGFDSNNPLDDGFFSGSTLNVTLAPVVAVLLGDYNSDGFVSQGDLDLVLLNWGDAVLPPNFNALNIDGTNPFDNLISQNELDGVLLNWGNGTPPSSITAVPEPASAGLLTFVGLVLTRRRR